MGDYNWRQNKQVEQGDFRPLPPLVGQVRRAWKNDGKLCLNKTIARYAEPRLKRSHRGSPGDAGVSPRSRLLLMVSRDNSSSLLTI